jgi:HKD family nuclease
MNDQLLPTGTFGSWNIAQFRSSLIDELEKSRSALLFQLYFYAVTLSGWHELAEPVKRWKAANEKRSVIMYVGTDHGLTDPSALEQMRKDGVDVRMMTSYSGIFHPKVAWLSGPRKHHVWVGSNNMTRDGLVNNVEFAVMVSSDTAPAALSEWAQKVMDGSTPINDALLKSYRSERNRFERHRVKTKSETFTWSRRTEPDPKRLPRPRPGDLILEIMPKETRGGNQIQIPKEATKLFLGLDSVGDQLAIELKQKGEGPFRKLIITMFENETVRLSINELEYRDRPCMIVLRKLSAGQLEFEIIPKSIFPARYKSLMAACSKQTRRGSRHWAIV